jgi:hypothetical protein
LPHISYQSFFVGVQQLFQDCFSQQEAALDPITTAILAGLVSGVTVGATEVGKKAIVDAYEGLKSIIKRKFGDQSDLAEAITKLESKQDSEGRKTTLQEEVKAVQADKDADILAAVKALEEKLVQHGGERVQKMLRSEGGEQIMRGRGGIQEQDMTDSPKGKQTME